MDQDTPGQKKPEPIDHYDIRIKYSITSSLGGLENNRYRQEIEGEIFLVNDDDEHIATIGTLTADKLLMGRAIDDGWGLYPVCDIEQYLMDIGQAIYDFEYDYWPDKLNEIFNNNLIQMDILILTDLTLVPEHKSFDIEKYIIKDLFNNFSQGTSLFIVLCDNPEYSGGDNYNFWKLNASGSKLIKNKKYRFNSAIKNYEKIGFRHIPELATYLVFMCPDQRNLKFDKVVLE